MVNLILTLLVVPFVPIFFWGGAGDGDGNHSYLGVIRQNLVSFTEGKAVLGETDEKKENLKEYESAKKLPECNLFPLDQADSRYMPIRKKNYADIKVWAGSSVAIDVDSGTILHYDNGRKRTQIASLTKIMTAILVLENIQDLNNEEVIITGEALNVPGTVVGCPTSVFCPSNRMYRGEKIYAMDLLKVMLLNSANDAATALGIHIAGSADKFTDMMNAKAKDLGLKDTNFCTPSGLEIDGREDQCYSSAYDIARIGAYSLRHSLIWDIMRIEEGRFYSADGTYMHEMKNTDLLLGDMPDCLGGKTGFTPMAGKSLLLGTADPQRKHKVIAVILNDEDRWTDMRRLVGWVFDNYEWR